MVLLNFIRQFNKPRIIISSNSLMLKNNYAVVAAASLGKVKKGKKGMGPAPKVELPVETDAHRLVNYVCGTNLLKEGGEDVKLKPDSEYPDWLWKIHVGKPKTLEDLDPNTKAYWRKLRKQAIRTNNQRLKHKTLGPF
ncbi:39S ribosomal protein L54, mitochondrial [Cotesia glomerata]|uniref:Large ribosomal subunit protein mL54 n=1 Tax=Cotesia glomerata TaxID=32391 RepID=A0AAV7HCS3_COTGL|nr:39S ribosomal protein L54, mitochondrial [Cotesia glomerata]KAH0534508.1 hypothetical protein KQX54_004672 [Cotesia glomerata]